MPRSPKEESQAPDLAAELAAVRADHAALADEDRADATRGAPEAEHRERALAVPRGDPRAQERISQAVGMGTPWPPEFGYVPRGGNPEFRIATDHIRSDMAAGFEFLLDLIPDGRKRAVERYFAGRAEAPNPLPHAERE